jgi:hypothetical protein
MAIPEISGVGGIETDNEICIPNISKAEQRKRPAAGAIQFLFGLGILAVLLVFWLKSMVAVGASTRVHGGSFGLLPMAREDLSRFVGVRFAPIGRRS